MRFPNRTQMSSVATFQAWMYPSGYISPTGYIGGNDVRTCVLVGFLFCLGVPACQSEPDRTNDSRITAERMARYCGELLEGTDILDGRVSMLTTYNTGLCWGGFTSMVSVWRLTYNARYANGATFHFGTVHLKVRQSRRTSLCSSNT
jgi:hypothetical protein